RPTRSFIQFVELGTVSELLVKTLRSSTFKQALIWIVLFGAIVIALLGYVYWSTISYVHSQSDRTIRAEQASLQRTHASGGPGALIASIKDRTSDKRFEDEVFLLADASFAPIAGNLERWPEALEGSEGWVNFSAREWRPDATKPPVLRAVIATLPDGYHLLVGKEVDDLDEFAWKIKTALALSITLIFVLAGVASISVTRRTVGRIEAINATSRAIMKDGLDRRIPLRGTQDEWDRVAERLNHMLDRIETLMGEVKQVTDNVAHDLRTPLARMRGRLEKAYSAPRDGGSDQTLIGATLDDLDVVLGMFSALTRISQIESSDRRSAFRSVDLTEMASEVVELFDAAAEEKGGRLRLVGSERVLITGERSLLFDAIANVVDNAIKHGGAAPQVTVEVTHTGHAAVISIADNGPGIPVEEHPHVFKRFYRLERSRRAPGNGLGLSLVAAIAGLHGARIEMLDNMPGLEFRLCFPAPASFQNQ